MKKLNIKGFTHLEVLLVIVVIALIGGAAFYVWKENDKKKDTPTSQATKDSSAKTSQTTEQGLKEYKNTEHGFSFQYPQDWKVTEKLEK